eukprot:3390890-Prymnesium_polylepis.1
MSFEVQSLRGIWPFIVTVEDIEHIEGHRLVTLGTAGRRALGLHFRLGVAPARYGPRGTLRMRVHARGPRDVVLAIHCGPAVAHSLWAVFSHHGRTARAQSVVQPQLTQPLVGHQPARGWSSASRSIRCHDGRSNRSDSSNEHVTRDLCNREVASRPRSLRLLRDSIRGGPL